MENFKSYRDLIVWQRAMDLTEIVYRDTTRFPKEETYGLTSQLRRAAVSVAANISEGHARNTTGEFNQFLGIASGSLAEVETLIMLSKRLGYLSGEGAESILKSCDEVSRMLSGLKKSLKK